MSGTQLSGVAVVTGGASGIGAACGAELGARGAQVVLLDRDKNVHEVAATMNARSYTADVTDDDALEHIDPDFLIQCIFYDIQRIAVKRTL